MRCDGKSKLPVFVQPPWLGFIDSFTRLQWVNFLNVHYMLSPELPGAGRQIFFLTVAEAAMVPDPLLGV